MTHPHGGHDRPHPPWLLPGRRDQLLVRPAGARSGPALVRGPIRSRIPAVRPLMQQKPKREGERGRESLLKQTVRATENRSAGGAAAVRSWLEDVIFSFHHSCCCTAGDCCCYCGVCVCVYAHLHILTHARIHTHTRLRTHLYMQIRICTHPLTTTYARTRVHTRSKTLLE